MPPAYLLTPQAVDDLGDIWDYIAEDSVSAANRVESAILAACVTLSKHPRLGSKRSEIAASPVRFWAVSSFPNFVVVYISETRPLQVVAILHGKRDLRTLLAGRGTR